MIISDASEKMTLFHQFNSNSWILLDKEQKKSAIDILYPNRVSPYEMELTYGLT